MARYRQDWPQTQWFPSSLACADLSTFAFDAGLLAFPRFFHFFARHSGRQGTLTSLKKYLALQLGVIPGTSAITIIIVLPNEWPTLQSTTDPNHHPLPRPVTTASLVMALFSNDSRSLGALTTTMLLGSGIVGLFGLWMVCYRVQ